MSSLLAQVWGAVLAAVCAAALIVPAPQGAKTRPSGTTLPRSRTFLSQCVARTTKNSTATLLSTFDLA